MNISCLRLGVFLLVGMLFSVVQTQAEIASKRILVDLYGHSLAFNLEHDFYYQRAQCLNETNLTESVELFMNDAQSDTLIKQMEQYAVELKMDDMAFLTMLNKVTNTVLKNESKDCKTLF